jgi:hypothetical protein
VDTLLQVVVSIGMYVIVFVVIGLVFYAADRRVKSWLRRPALCRSCSAEITAGAPGAARNLCPGCAAKRMPAARRR